LLIFNESAISHREMNSNSASTTQCFWISGKDEYCLPYRIMPLVGERFYWQSGMDLAWNRQPNPAVSS